MYEINLIREKAISPVFKKNIENYFKIGVGICFLIFICIIFKFINTTSKIKKLEHEKININTEIKNMIAKYNIKDWAGQWQSYHDSLNLIKNIYEERIIWNIRLSELMRLLPEKMCIEKISTIAEGNNISVKLLALDDGKGEFDQIKKFNEILEKSDYFGMVKLESQERIKLEEKDIKVIKILLPLEFTSGNKK